MLSRRAGVSRASRSAGFVITLEFLLIMALVVLPVMLGLFLLGRKFVTLYLNQEEAFGQFYSTGVVWDSAATPRVVGPVVGYDQFETPLVIFRDEDTKAGVLLGVRTDRFTSFGQVFYDQANCQGDAYIRAHDAPLATGGNTYPPIGFAYQTQGSAYAMGIDNILWRSTDDAATSVFNAPASVWISQDYSTTLGAPCFTVGATVDDLVAADQVIDFDAVDYVPPFRLAFPTASAAPPLPSGE
jgi:hypothetical protein